MKVALVTGAARGIGAATVDQLVADGFHVTALDSCAGTPLAEPDELDLVVKRRNGRVHAEVADVRDRAALETVVASTVERWGRLDAVVAGAAIVAGGRPLWETPPEELASLWDVDVAGVWNTAAATIPAMLTGPDPTGCRFVAIASAAGHTGLYNLAGYTAAKHAVVGITKALAADLRGTGITACSISPGSTDTAMLDATAALYGVDRAELIAHQALGRALTPAEIAATIGFACSAAGATLNGTDVHADGGFTG